MKKNISIIILLAVAVLAVIAIKNNNKKETDSSYSCTGGICSLPTKQEIASQTNTVAENAEKKQSLPKLLDLGASKCVPCKMMEPILDEMRETFTDQLDVIFIDVWKNQAAGQEYGIRMIPTQIFFDANGKELFRHEGFISREDILAKWQELGIVLKDKPQGKEE